LYVPTAGRVSQVTKLATEESKMRSLRIALVVGALVALAIAIPSASASTGRNFHVEKDCANFRCVITSSSYKGIAAGSEINYSVNADGSLTAVISAAHGTATGRCVLSSLPGSCVFSSGTGSLTQFHLNVAVTTTDGVTWFWDGSYWFGNGG
jgi:hypothetical protein